MSADNGVAETTVADAAAGLGCGIRKTPQWREWQAALKAVRDDPELARMASRLRELTELWRRASAESGALSGKEAVELEEIREQLERSVVFRRKRQAECGLIELLQKADRALSLCLRVDFAASVVSGAECCRVAERPGE